MAISQKVRFEIFKRDGFQCRYCGKRPPEIILHIDHILPRKLKGTDHIENLITACSECNLGKAARPLNVLPSADIKRLKDIREREKQLREFYKHQEFIETEREKDVGLIANKFMLLEGDEYSLSDYGRLQMKNLLKTFTRFEITDAMELAWSQKPNLDSNDKFKYTCGILWRKRERRNDE